MEKIFEKNIVPRTPESFVRRPINFMTKIFECQGQSGREIQNYHCWIKPEPWALETSSILKAVDVENLGQPYPLLVLSVHMYLTTTLSAVYYYLGYTHK